MSKRKQHLQANLHHCLQRCGRAVLRGCKDWIGQSTVIMNVDPNLESGWLLGHGYLSFIYPLHLPCSTIVADTGPLVSECGVECWSKALGKGVVLIGRKTSCKKPAPVRSSSKLEPEVDQSAMKFY